MKKFFSEVLVRLEKSHWSIKILLLVLGLLYAPLLLVAALAAIGGYKLAQQKLNRNRPLPVDPYA